jgi:hypothetical protein
MAKRPRSVPDAIDALPHWARVAFAARCARKVLPLLRDAWPAAPASRVGDLEKAIEFAERSAAAAETDAESIDVVVNVVATAGAALCPTYGVALDEPEPAGEAECHIASFAAKAAEWAARAALADPAESNSAALEAFGFVRKVAQAAEHPRVVSRLAREAVRLARRAARRGWVDHTPVAPSAFKGLSKDEPDRPWWRFW